MGKIAFEIFYNIGNIFSLKFNYNSDFEIKSDMESLKEDWENVGRSLQDILGKDS